MSGHVMRSLNVDMMSPNLSYLLLQDHFRLPWQALHHIRKREISVCEKDQVKP